MLEKEVKLEVTESEYRLLQIVRKLGYGEITVMIEKGKPVEIEESRQSLILSR